MLRINKQIATIIEDQLLCDKVCDSYDVGYSIRYIADKYQISRYAVKKLAALRKSHDMRATVKLNNNTKPLSNYEQEH